MASANSLVTRRSVSRSVAVIPICNILVVNATREPEQDRQQRWQLERQRILASRAKVEREASEAGVVLVHALPEPPTTPPDWFEQDDRQTQVEYSRSSEPSDTITMPYGPLGKPPEAGAGELTPEQVFAKASIRDKIKRVTGVSLPI